MTKEQLKAVAEAQRAAAEAAKKAQDAIKDLATSSEKTIKETSADLSTIQRTFWGSDIGSETISKSGGDVAAQRDAQRQAEFAMRRLERAAEIQDAMKTADDYQKRILRGDLRSTLAAAGITDPDTVAAALSGSASVGQMLQQAQAATATQAGAQAGVSTVQTGSAAATAAVQPSMYVDLVGRSLALLEGRYKAQ
jgi:hypothetical protein